MPNTKHANAAKNENTTTKRNATRADKEKQKVENAMPKEPSKELTDSLDKANLAKAQKRATAADWRKTPEGELVYHYPEDIKDNPDAKKTFRRKARSAMKRFQDIFLSLQGKRDKESLESKKEAEKEYESFVSHTYDRKMMTVGPDGKNHREHTQERGK